LLIQTMLFHSSLRRELARSFGATLLVLITIVVTMLLIRTLGLANKGSVNPEEILLVLTYTVLGRMPTVLTLALFIAVVSTLSRLYRDSEMVIWLGSGLGLTSFLRPIFRFAWPILLVITLLVLFVWPWGNEQTEALRDRFQKRSDLERIAPGQFMESSNGQRVFFIDKTEADDSEGRNVFIATQEAGRARDPHLGALWPARLGQWGAGADAGKRPATRVQPAGRWHGAESERIQPLHH
jgi:lipopolysaccharide export system permease protein